MFKLIIKKPDQSIYWTESFNELPDLNKWLLEEKTRPYWNNDFTSEIIDNTPPEKTPEEVAAEKAKEEKKKTDHVDAVIALKVIDLNNISTADLKIIAKHLVMEFLKDEI